MKPSLAVLCLVICFASSPLMSQEAPPTPKKVTSLQELVEILKAEKIEHQANIPEQYVVIPVKRGGLNSAQVIRWAARDGFVHFIQVIPVQIPDENLTVVESAMVRINHSYPVPGLGMNHDNNTTYFRFTVPILPRGFLLESEVKEYFSFSVNQAVQLLPTIKALAEGEVAAEDALEFHRNRIQQALGPLGAWRREFGDSQWVMKVTPKGEVTLEKDGKIVVDSLVNVKDDQMTFDDVTGELAVEGKGTYKFKIEGKTMTFTVVEDASEGRKQVLSSGPWTR